MNVKLSVVIPTHNRAATLLQTLNALEDQTLPRAQFEVLLVDDGSDEEHRRRLRQQRPPFEFQLLEKSCGGLASARNLGASRAAGEILHFLDDDVIPGRDTLRQHLSTHQEREEPVAVIGSLPFAETIERTAFLWYMERSGHYDLYENPRKYPGGRPPLPPLNGNSSIARAVFLEVGRYDESFRRYGSEDLELGHRLARAGVGFVYNPAAVGFHNHVKDFPQFCRDMETAGESLIQLYRKYPEIRADKKIDLLEDRLGQLPVRKKLIRLVMLLTLERPGILGPPRWLIGRFGSRYGLRHPLFPLYRWVAHYHYAVGMRRGLSA